MLPADLNISPIHLNDIQVMAITMQNTRLNNSFHVNSYGSLNLVFHPDLHKRSRITMVPSCFKIYQTDFFAENGEVKLQKKTACSQEYNSEHQNLVITASFDS